MLALILLVPLVGRSATSCRIFRSWSTSCATPTSSRGSATRGGRERPDRARTTSPQTIPDAITALLGVAGNAFSVGLALFTMLFLALFLLVDMPRLKESCGRCWCRRTPSAGSRSGSASPSTVSRWAIGAITIAAIAGTTQGLTASLLGSSYALALGLIAGFLDLIPNIGATIAGFILVPTIWAEEGLTDALIMLAVVLVYQQLENNLLSPTIYGKAVNILPFFVILGVTLFGALLGVLGALVAVPITASLQIVLQEVTKARRARIAEVRAEADRLAADAAPAPTPPLVVLEALWWGAFASSSLVIGGVIALRLR